VSGPPATIKTGHGPADDLLAIAGGGAMATGLFYRLEVATRTGTVQSLLGPFLPQDLPDGPCTGTR
jgi:hypothetical protein